MDGSSVESPRRNNGRFLANINAEDSIHKSANLLEEILGKKLDKLKVQTALRDSAQKSSNTNTRVQESKVEDSPKDKPDKIHKLELADRDYYSVQVKPKHSLQQSEQSQSQIESLMSGSLQKRKSAEKDQYNITTQDGFKSEKNSEMFDLRVYKVPVGVIAQLDSVSQGSGDNGLVGRDQINEIDKFTPFDKVLESDKKPQNEGELQYRRSHTEKKIKQQHELSLESSNKKPKQEASLSKFHDFNTRARRTPTDSFVGNITPTPANLSEKTVLMKGKTLLQKHRDSRMIGPLQPNTSLVRPFDGVKAPATSNRGMLEYSSDAVGPRSTDNLPINEHSTVLSPRPDNIMTNRERPAELLLSPITKGYVKQQDSKNSPQKSDINSSQRSLSPGSSKRGILINRDKVYQSNSLSVYEMAGMPTRKSNSFMSRRAPAKVRFKDENEVFHVASYKEFYKQSFIESTSFCSRCSLI
jgi:hypothetical protein